MFKFRNLVQLVYKKWKLMNKCPTHDYESWHCVLCQCDQWKCVSMRLQPGLQAKVIFFILQHKVYEEKTNIFIDLGSMNTLITHDADHRLGLKGQHTMQMMETVGWAAK